MKTPRDLDLITDVVLAYRPKSKSRTAKKRAKRKKKVAAKS